MKKRFITIIITLFIILPCYAFAANDGNVLWLSDDKIRSGNITISDIPTIILNAVNFFMSFAGWIAVMMIIVWAYQMQFWSLSSDKSKWKRTIMLALTWFALAALSWMIVKFIIDNFS
jgi:hypothetical protein